MGKGQKIHRESKSRKTNSEKRRRNIEKNVGASKRRTNKCSRSAQSPQTTDNPSTSPSIFHQIHQTTMQQIRRRPRDKRLCVETKTPRPNRITTANSRKPKNHNNQATKNRKIATNRSNKQTKNAADQRKAQGQAIMRCNKKPKAKPHHHCF